MHADVRGDLPHVTAPTLVLQGDHGWDGKPLRPEDDVSLALSCPVTPSSESAVVFVNGERDGMYGSVATFSLRR